MNKTIIEQLRCNYNAKTFDITDALPQPFLQFEAWLQDAIDAELLEPNAMSLATVDERGRPSARIVLLKGIDEGFVFYTNYDSKKGQDIVANPYAALVFVWLPLERQVRIEGRVERVSQAQSEAYFQSRPKGSQIGAAASPQSKTVADRAELEAYAAAVTAKYADSEVLPLPENWGGFRVIPERIEFWQGRSSRLHDRIVYTLQNDGTWLRTRLAP